MEAPIVITKRSPVVLIRTFAIIELVAFGLYFLGSLAFFDIYKQLMYDILPLSALFPYQAFKFPFLFLTQFLITAYAFLRWYYEVYTIRSGLISYQRGVFFKKTTTTPIDKSMSVTVSSGPLGKLLHFGTIIMENNGTTSMILADISYPEHFLRKIQSFMHPNDFHASPNIHHLLSEEEHERLEFKSSLRFDYKTGQVNRNLEKAVMKTIAAFLNSQGGHLIIGVDDTRKALGLDKDYKTLKRPDADGFENHFTQVFNAMIGPEFRHLINMSFHDAQNGNVCVIQSTQSTRPVYLRVDNNEHFYIRTGNVTTPLKLSEIELYSRSRWPSQFPDL